MTPAERYIAAQYEAAVDRGLNVAQIRDHLATQGIRRLVSQVVHELDHVYCFAGYSASHPAPAALTLTQVDDAIS